MGKCAFGHAAQCALVYHTPHNGDNLYSPPGGGYLVNAYGLFITKHGIAFFEMKACPPTNGQKLPESIAEAMLRHKMLSSCFLRRAENRICGVGSFSFLQHMRFFAVRGKRDFLFGHSLLGPNIACPALWSSGFIAP